MHDSEISLGQTCCSYKKKNNSLILVQMSALVFMLKKHVSVMFFQRHPENTGTLRACPLGVSLHRMVVLVGGAR